MKQFLQLAFVLFIVLALSVGVVQAQDATQEPSPDAVETPVVVDTVNEDHLTWRELGLYALVATAVISTSIIAYRLVTTVGVSFPPGTAEALTRAYQTGQGQANASANKYDDLLFLFGDPLVQEALKAVKEREKANSLPDGSVG